MSTTFRPATDTDREFLFAVYASTRAEELDPVPWTQAQKAAFLRQQFEAQDQAYRAKYPPGTFQVIEVEGMPAGRLYLHRGETEIRLVDIALLPAYRGLGLGTAILHELLADAAATNRPVHLHVEQFNRAQHLYRRLGFTVTGEAGYYLQMQWSPATGAPTSP